MVLRLTNDFGYGSMGEKGTDPVLAVVESMGEFAVDFVKALQYFHKKTKDGFPEVNMGRCHFHVHTRTKGCN
jgi:hypothetical protein